MSALGEQLVHDYLSRVFAAGRGRLPRADRQALVMRTGAFIEQNTGPVGSVSELDVAKFLTELGDPAAIVDAEQDRLADTRGGHPAEPAGRAGVLGRVLPRFVSQGTRRWPSQPAGSPRLLQSLMAAAEDEVAGEPDEPVLTGRIIMPDDEALAPDEMSEATPDRPATGNGHGPTEPAPSEILELGPRPTWPTVVARNASWLDSILGEGPPEEDAAREPTGSVDQDVLDGEVLDGEVLDGEVLDGEDPIYGKALDEDPMYGKALDENAFYGDASYPDVPDGDAFYGDAPGGDMLAGDVSDGDAPGGAAPDDDGPDEETPADEALGEYVTVAAWVRHAAGRATLLAVSVADRFRKQPVESVAATLLGIGGAAFPPVWLLGAAVALASRIWDRGDKWAGLALPVLATVVGTVIGVCLTAGSSLGHDIHNGWLFADILSRVAAVLGASYLAWRAVHGRRPPAVPPWAKAHKLG
jgi:hypothetical protein